jgi:aspartate/methionine/tyrosine aminotransferase
MLDCLSNPAALRYEPDPRGLPAAREAVAAYYAGSVDAGNVILTASTSESYSFLFKLLADAGGELLVPRPSYPLFEFLAALESLRVVQYPLVYHGGWEIDLGALSHALTERTRAIVLVNPNNPTGSFLKRRETLALFDICSERGIAIISDEVFSDYALRPDPQRVSTLAGQQAALAFSLSGLSKVVGLPQMKVGWIAVSGPAPLRSQAVERLELVADTYLPVAAPMQHALPELLARGAEVRRQIRSRTAANLQALLAWTAPNPALRVLDVEGGWYAILQAPRVLAEEEWVLALLREDRVLVQPGYFYDFESEAFLVISLLTRPEVFRSGCERLLARVNAVLSAL